VNDIDARLWHPWLGINRVLRVMLLIVPNNTMATQVTLNMNDAAPSTDRPTGRRMSYD